MKIDLSKEEIEILKKEIALELSCSSFLLIVLLNNLIDVLSMSKKDIGEPNRCCETMMEYQIRTANERR